MLTQKRLKELLSYDPKTGVFTWNVSPSNSVKTGSIAGNLSVRGYRQIIIDGSRYYEHRLAWFYVYGVWPGGQIDHKNHIRDDNRISNLRDVTHLVNQHNQSMPSNNTSGFVGVYWHKTKEKWQSYIMIDGKNKHLGYFDNIDFAIAARREAEIKQGYHENHGNQKLITA